MTINGITMAFIEMQSCEADHKMSCNRLCPVQCSVRRSTEGHGAWRLAGWLGLNNAFNTN